MENLHIFVHSHVLPQVIVVASCASGASSVVLPQAKQIDKEGRARSRKRRERMPQEVQIDNRVAHGEARSLAAVGLDQIVVCAADSLWSLFEKAGRQLLRLHRCDARSIRRIENVSLNSDRTRS